MQLSHQMEKHSMAPFVFIVFTRMIQAYIRGNTVRSIDGVVLVVILRHMPKPNTVLSWHFQSVC